MIDILVFGMNAVPVHVSRSIVVVIIAMAVAVFDAWRYRADATTFLVDVRVETVCKGRFPLVQIKPLPHTLARPRVAANER